MTDTVYDLSATLVCDGLDPDTFDVLSFEGEEAISCLFAFEIQLLSANSKVDLASLVGQAATFEIDYDGTTRTIYGVIGRARLGDPFLAERYLYEVTLVPRIAALALSHGYQIHLGRTTPEIIEAELTAASRQGLKEIAQFRLTDSDFTLSTKEDYPAWEYRCQYDESDLSFISRLMEYEGMFYYFDHANGFDKLIVGDDNIFFQGADDDLSCEYQRGDLDPYLERVYTFRLTETRVPEAVAVNDYNYRTPELGLLATSTADTDGTGAVHSFGEHHLTASDGARLAKVRAEAAALHKETFEGAGHHILFEPGREFTLSNHFRDDLDGCYRIVSVHHRGRLRVAGADGDAAPDAAAFGYHNTFTCIPEAVPFRPARTTPVPKVDGLVSAHVDSETPGYQADVDSQGRYLLRMPFDLSGRPDGKASARVRLATPLAGAGEGLHFPLRKGTEVLIAHTLGDPDRPVIVAAVPNPGTQTTVTSTNAPSSVFSTASGMRLAFQDNPGVAVPITHVPPPPETLSTITPPGGSGGDDASDGSQNGTGTSDEDGTGARSLSAAAVTSVATRTLSAAASSSATVDGDITQESDQDKSVQISVPDYRSDGDEKDSTYLRLGGTPSQTITVNGSSQTNPNYEIEVDKLVEVFGVSEDSAKKSLASVDLGWFDFTDGGRVSLTEGYKADRIHTGGKTIDLEYSSAADEKGIAWDHKYMDFSLESKITTTSMELFAGSKADGAAAAVVEFSATLGMEIAVGSKVAITGGFNSEVGLAFNYERNYGPETLEVHSGEYEQTAKKITLSAGMAAQVADEVQSVATASFVASTVFAGVVGVLTGLGVAGDSADLESEQLLTSGERNALTAAEAFSAGLFGASIAENLAMMASYASVRSAMTAEELEHPPELCLDSETNSAELSVGAASIKLEADKIVLAVGMTAINITATGIEIVAPESIEFEIGEEEDDMALVANPSTTLEITPELMKLSSPEINMLALGEGKIDASVMTIGSLSCEALTLKGDDIKANETNLLGA